MVDVMSFGMKKYILVDFKDIVSRWYNNFLPELANDKVSFVKDAGIIYINSISLEPKIRESLSYILKQIQDIRRVNSNSTILVVQEPKAVNNIDVHGFLKYIETNNVLDDEHKNRVLHLANKRYIATSPDILVAQDKEIDEFLDKVFLVLSKVKMDDIKFICSESLPFHKVVDAAFDIFPRSRLVINESYVGNHINVESSSNTILDIASKLGYVDATYDSTKSSFLKRATESISSRILVAV